MLKFTSQIKKVFSNLVQRFTANFRYKLQYYSEKSGEIVSRVCEGKPHKMSNGNFIYKDVTQGGMRSYKPQNFHSLKLIGIAY